MYVAIPQTDYCPVAKMMVPSCDDAIYPINTEKEIEEAKDAMREHGVVELYIFAGDGADSYQTSSTLFA